MMKLFCQVGLRCHQETASQPTAEERQEEMQSEVSSMISWQNN